MAGQIGHRELVGAIGRTCAVSGPQRTSAARKRTVRTLLAPPAQASLLGRPFGRAEGAIRHRHWAHVRGCEGDAILVFL